MKYNGTDFNEAFVSGLNLEDWLAYSMPVFFLDKSTDGRRADLTDVWGLCRKAQGLHDKPEESVETPLADEDKEADPPAPRRKK